MAMFDSVRDGEKVQPGMLLRKFADKGLVGGEMYRGDWVDVGTVERFEMLNAPFEPRV